MREKDYLDLLGEVVPGDIVSIEFSERPRLKHYGIVAENILYVYDFSVFNGKDSQKGIVQNNVEDIPERMIVQKRTWKQFQGESTNLPQIEEDYRYDDDQRIITLLRAAILAKVFKEKILRERIYTTDFLKPFKKLLNSWFIKPFVQLIDSDSSEYNLWYSNCEHVATWCKTGIWDSRQVNAVLSAWKFGLLSFPRHGKTLLRFFIPSFGNQRSFTEYPKSHLKIGALIISYFLKFTFYHFLFRIKSVFNRPDFLDTTYIPESLRINCDQMYKDYLRKNRLIVVLLLVIILILSISIIFNINQIKTIFAPKSSTNYPVTQIPLDDNNKYYYVKKDDNLRKIAKNCYGSEEKWQIIYNTNKLIIGDDPDIIPKKIFLTIPVDSNNGSYIPNSKHCPLKKAPSIQSN